MCSIPGLPMPQSEASVVIARVKLNHTCDFVQLWVSMEGGHKHRYEKMREEIQTPERKFCGPEGKPEDLCLVRVSDAWHRARIVSVQDETCSVFLIDQGKLHDTTSEALAWARNESFVLPPEIESCILANVLSVSDSWSEKATKFFSSLPGKNFTGVVEHVLMPDRIILLDLPVVSAHMLRLGVTETVPAEEFKCLALNSLHLLKEGTSEELGLTQEHKLNINGQLEKLDLTFGPEPLADDHETVVNDDGLELGTFPSPEDPVVRDRTEDESTCDKQLKVPVMQTGTNSELGVPQYAVKGDTDVSGLMQKYRRLSLKDTPQDTHPEGKITQSVSKSLSKNRTITAYGSCISEPHFFWCQYSNTEDLNTVLELAQEAGQTRQHARFAETLGPGSWCLALFSSDNRWYRARVTQKVDDVFHVVFLDYGNEAEVEKENVRAPTRSLLDIPPQALLCSLSGFKKSEGSWTDEAYDDFYNLLVDKPLKVTLLGVEKHSENGIPQYFVEVDCEGLHVNAAMQKYWKPATEQCVSKEKLPADLLQSSKENVTIGMYKEPKISPNMTETVYASCIAEPHYFWCQHTNTEDLNKVLDLAQEAAQAQQDTRFAETLGPGSRCLALFSSDNRWYRAQVTRRVEDVFHVVFIDYGNELEVDINGVRSLPQRLLEIAPLAFLCSLNGFEKWKGSWADEVYDEFYNRLVDKPLRLTVVSMERHSEASAPQYSVDVECEGVAVNTLMRKYWKELDVGETSVGKAEIRGPERYQDSGGDV